MARGPKELKKLRNLVGQRIATHVFAAGVVPRMDYGAQVNGMSDKELKVMEKVAGAAMACGASGRSHMKCTTAIGLTARLGGVQLKDPWPLPRYPWRG